MARRSHDMTYVPARREESEIGRLCGWVGGGGGGAVVAIVGHHTDADGDGLVMICVSVEPPREDRNNVHPDNIRRRRASMCTAWETICLAPPPNSDPRSHRNLALSTQTLNPKIVSGERVSTWSWHLSKTHPGKVLHLILPSIGKHRKY